MDNGRQPILIFTLEGLVDLLNEPGVKSAMKNAGLKQFNHESLQRLATELAINSQPHTVPSNFVEVYHTKGNQIKRVEKLAEVSRWDIKTVNDHIVTCRCDPKLPYKQSASFVQPITEDSPTQYKHLVTLTQRIKALWMDIGAGVLARRKSTFYLKYLQIAFAQRNAKKFNMATLIDGEVHTQTLSILNNLHALKTDPNNWLTSAMYRAYIQQFERTEDGHLFTNEDSRYPFFSAGRLLLQTREQDGHQDSKELTLKLVPVWVAAQKQAFDRANGSRDVKLELGYLQGANSADRFRIFVTELARTKKQEEQQPPTKAKRKITDITRKRL